MKNYNNSKIYKIEPTCEYDEGDIYIGSTNREYLCQRMAAHKYQYKKYKEGLFNKITSFDIFEKYGVENVNIVLIELVNANSKDELILKESEYIRNTKCINKVIPNRTQKEYIQEKKEKIRSDCKNYREQNKEKIKIKDKKYYKNNREKILEQKKQYYANQKLKKAMEI